MAMRMGDIRGMKEDALEKKLAELEMELVTGQGQGTKARSIRLSIARIKTAMSQAKKPVQQERKHTSKHPVVEHPKVVGGEQKKSLNTGREKKD